jgi:ribonucleoside-diphosphate reductase alpha chain
MNHAEQPVLGMPAIEPQHISSEVLLEKYAKGEERNVHDVRTRVARALAVVEEIPAIWEPRFLDAQENGFVPAGRINSAAGTDIAATLINCFVQPVGDSSTASKPGEKAPIYQALLEAAETMRRGGGVGYSFGDIRPSGALVKGTHSAASGPISFMRVFDASCATVQSAGARRGAQMGVLPITHPDIEAFIHAKDKGELTNFNLSVGVTDAFMAAVAADQAVELVHSAQPGEAVLASGAYQRKDGMWAYRKVQARDLWEQIMRSTYDHAEPGILFLDRMNQENNLAYCEAIEATNPCAEQPLPDYGCCCLGSINLTLFVRDPFSPLARFDFNAFEKQVPVTVRMLDNVLDVTYWPLEKQRQEAMSKRRIGLGFLGLGDALIMLNLRYDSEEGRAVAASISESMRNAAYAESIELAKEKGAFPLLDRDAYLDSGFAKRLPEHIRDGIREYGIRNSHLLSIAPTGTITLAFADNASNGIEPAFSWTYPRKKTAADGSKVTHIVEDHAYRVFRAMFSQNAPLTDAFVGATEMAAMDHLRMLQAVQPFIDTSISKTVNVPVDYPYTEFESLYMEAWKAGLKGLATYRPNATLGAVLGDVPAAEAPKVQDIDPQHVQLPKRPAGDLEAITSKVEYQVGGERTSLYVSVSFAVIEGVLNGKPVKIERAIEFFLPAGQTTEDHQWVSYAMRLQSMVGRFGNGGVAKALQNMRETVWDRGPVRLLGEDGKPLPGFYNSAVAAIGKAIQNILIKRGLLDADGNQVPSRVLAARYGARFAAPVEGEMLGSIEPETVVEAPTYTATGKKCPGCGLYSFVMVDGCRKCLECGEQGACG